MEHAVRHIGEWLMHGAPGASETYGEITTDYSGQAREYVAKLLSENVYVFFDFTDVSRGLMKWVTVGDDDILRIKYGPSKGSSRCQTLAVVADDYSSIKRVSATYTVVRNLAGEEHKTFRFKRGEFVGIDEDDGSCITM